ncbi:MAG TPA: hypothetical protein VH583_10015 [Vicinamibacterales bacterium]
MAADFCPYVGLRPFTAAERAYFFGRERDQRVIAANLFASPLSVLYGPSAVGKSSVLQAGVVPQLATEPRTAIVYFATWQDDSYIHRLRAECAKAVAAAHGAPLDIDDALPIDEWLAQAAEKFRGTLLLVLDQFEEYLLYHSEDGDSSFDAELARIVNRRDVPANIMLGIREDGLAKLDRFRKRIPNLLGNLLRLRRLSPEAAREAITGPVEAYNRQGRTDGALPMQIEPALIDAVVDQVRAAHMQHSVTGGTGTTKAGDEGELIETALLQMVMTRLWRDATVVDGARVMRRASLDALGGARNVVKLHLYERMNELPPEGRAIAANLFQELVTPSGAKIAHTTDDLVAFAKQPATTVVPVLEHLARARLLRRVDPPERYEIFHDALASAILDWRAEYLQEIARQTALHEAEVQRKQFAQRRNRRIAAAVAILLVVAVSAFAAYAYREADRQRLIAAQSQARADKAEQLQQAAAHASEASERDKEVAELALQRGQLEVDSMKARLAGQLDKAAQLVAQAKSVDDRIATARTASAASSKQAQVNLAAAQTTQAKIDTINAQIEQKGIPLNKAVVPADTPAANAAAPPALAPAPAPATPTPAPTETPTKTTPQGDYKAIYRQAINARDRKRWSDAAQLFQSAASIRPDTGETISMPGFGDEQRYLPFYNLGVALQNMKDCAGAIKAWDQAEQAGAVMKSSRDADAMKKARAQCGGASR